MNSPIPEKNTNNVDQGILDAIELLVESELSEPDRHKLLSRLEAQPEYWRVMAVAFIEQQSILRSVRAGNMEGSQSTERPIQCTTPIFPRTRLPWPRLAMTVAGLFLMFALGYSLAIRYPNMEFFTKSELPQSEIDNPLAKEIEDVETSPLKSFPVARNVAGYVQWHEGTGNREMDTMLLPVFRGDTVDASWLESHPLVVDEKLVESLNQSGWVAKPFRHFVLIKLLGGESYTIPVDDLQFRFVGRNVY